MTNPLPRRRHTPVAPLAAAALALAVTACGADPAPAPAVMKVPVGASPVAGPADAWVTVVEFSDFQCGFCAQAHATLDAVLPEFGADVRLVYKHYPLSIHVHARATAEASVCAHAQGRFWEFHDIVFAEQGALMSATDFEGALAGVATRAGVDLAAWSACRADAATAATVSADAALGARVGVTGTPTLAVNGAPIVGSPPAAALRAAIESARATARASGIPAAQYYDRAVLGLPPPL